MLGLEDTASRMSRLGKNELNYGEYRSVGETVARIDAVTAEEVATLARNLLRGGGPAAAAVVGPYAHDDDLPHELHEVIA